MKLTIITPEKTAYSGEADYVVLNTEDGEVGILPGHLPLVTLLVPGDIQVEKGSEKEALAVDKGFAEVSNDEIRVLTEAAINVDEIDLDAVEKAEERARRFIAEAEGKPDLDPMELEEARGSLRFAIAQRLTKGKRLI
ncbi:MAG: ATP synthase F1 subunit epsilon [Verrucomicrobiota bacterium]